MRDQEYHQYRLQESPYFLLEIICFNVSYIELIFFFFCAPEAAMIRDFRREKKTEFRFQGLETRNTTKS
jgi:hypothetical protein